MSGSGRLVVRSADAGGTRALAARLAGLCRPGDVLLLAGGLGAGKTTFAQGFGSGLGLHGPVTSPTFTLVRQYPVERGGITTFFHVDVYRLDHLQEVVDLGLGELVGDGGVALVEWGDAAEPVLGAGALSVTMVVDADHDDHRTILLGPPAGTWVERWASVGRALAPWRADP